MKRHSARSQKKALTMAALAKACGVSPMTVSRALRSGVSVASQTQRRIRAMAEKSGYQVNGRFGRPRRAPAVAGQPTEIVIGTAIGGGNLYHARLMVAIERELSWHSCDCLIRTCGNDYDQFLMLCDALRRTKPTNLLIIGYFPNDRMQSLLDLAPHPILVDQTGNAGLTGPYEYIGFDNVEAARLAVRHLLDSGRRRILLIKGPVDHYFSRDIERGYREVFQWRQEGIDEKRIMATDFTAQGARQAVASALAAGVSFDAVFTNDEMALGVLRALHEAGIAVPRQVAVAGCDGLPVGLHTIPSLTTVEMDYQRLGQITVEQLFAREQNSTSTCRIQLAPTLVVRESTTVEGK
ncbi:MAG: LacI family transcriptional regulator [Verrucomicrobia bacterium]|nr:LacI family transcriptional regulator [Verrucomicrobiota bacterium]MBU1735067.1 LacI family transcriptional regulator [Verrucomicrobiota bacterium]MBU1857948.1 LacI family transcriptional regulator [Verrucomicrobiota bacterium]